MESGKKITLLFKHGVVLTQTREPPHEIGQQNEIRVYVYTGGVARLDPGDEGVTWLYGHHLYDSKEVEGLRVASALRAPQKSQPKPKPQATASQQMIGSIIGSLAADLIHKMIKEE